MPKDEWRINYDSPESYHNWVDPKKLDLTCKDEAVIGLIPSMYFVGFAVSCGIVPRIADLYGRKKSYVTSITI